MVRKIPWIERHDEVCVSRLRTNAERFVAGIGRNVAACPIRRFFRLGTDQVDCRADKTGAHSAPRKNRLVFIDDFFVDEPGKRAVVDPIPQQMGAGHKRLNPGVPECGNARHEDGSIDDASRPIFPEVEQLR